VILTLAPNSHEARILRPQYQKILSKVNAMSSHDSCTHIKVTGVRCGSPALRGEQFCYFHQNAYRGVRRPQQSRLHPIAIIEDEESIQYALMEVINALMRNTIDVKRAALIIRALHIAVKNASRVKFGILGSDAVKEIPDYAPPTAGHEATAQQAELPAVSAIEYKPIAPGDRHFWEYQEEGRRVLAREAQARKAAEAQASVRAAAIATAHVGTDAFARPASAASAPPAATTTTTKVATAPAIPPHDFKTPQPTTPAQSPSHRKPPEPVKPARKERKTTAHGASRG
jgi:hypothetical protein